MKNIFFWSLAVAVGGFLFGFDTAVISGADQPLQILWQSSDLMHGAMVMSSALWGTVFGALLGGVICERFGRKRILVTVAILYFISALGSAVAGDPYFFAFMRLLGGFWCWHVFNCGSSVYCRNCASSNQRKTGCSLSISDRIWYFDCFLVQLYLV